MTFQACPHFIDAACILQLEGMVADEVPLHALRSLTIGKPVTPVAPEPDVLDSPATVVTLEIGTSPTSQPQSTASTGGAATAEWGLGNRFRPRPESRSPQPVAEEGRSAVAQAAIREALIRGQETARPQPRSQPRGGREDRVSQDAGSRSRDSRASRELCPLCAPEDATDGAGAFCELCVALLGEEGTDVIEMPCDVLGGLINDLSRRG